MALVTLESFLETNRSARYKTSYLKRFLPLMPSKPLAEISAALMTDGHLELYKGIRPKKIVFYSNSIKNLNWFNRQIWKIFSVKGNLVEYEPYYGYDKSKTRYKIILNNAAVARTLLMSGIPGGDKTRKDFDIPYWIKSGTKRLKRSFLQRLFDFDGSIPVKRKGRRAAWNIQFFTTKHEANLNSGEQYCSSIIELLNDFDIDARTCVYKNSTDKFTFLVTIFKQKSILNFAKNIGYGDTEKQNKLDIAVKNILTSISFSGSGIKDLLEILKLRIGTDKASIMLINNSLGTDYTRRQFEHWRRGEIKTQLPVIKFACDFLGCKIRDYVDFPQELLFMKER